MGASQTRRAQSAAGWGHPALRSAAAMTRCAKASPFKGRWHAVRRDGEVKVEGFACTTVGAPVRRWPTSQSAPPTAPLKRGAFRIAGSAIGTVQTRRRSRRGGYHPPAMPIAACSKLECHSEAMKWPWNLTDYGMPVALQRLINTCPPERSRRVCRLRYGCAYCQRWKLTILYRNRKDSPIRGRCHAAVGGSE